MKFPGKNQAGKTENKSAGSGGRKVGTRVLLRVVALVVVIFIVSGLISFLFFRNSQKTLIRESKEQLVESKVALTSSPNAYLVNLMTKIVLLSIPGATPQSIQAEFTMGIASKEITQTQQMMNEMLTQMIDAGLFNYELAFFALPPVPGINTSPMIIATSNVDDIYGEVPDSLTSLAKMTEDENTRDRARIDDDNSYMLAKNGIPELGLEGEFLVNAHRYRPGSSPTDLWYYSFSSIGEQFAAIDNFYNTEQRRVNLIMILVVVGSIFALVIITYFVLSYMIRRRITKPIKELSDTAAKVIEGDIDVEVPVTAGEEFEGLKNAFNEMLATLRKVIYRSIEGSPGAGGAPEEHVRPGKEAKKRFW